MTALAAVHPGPAQYPRRQCLQAPASQSFLVQLAGPGELFDACSRVARRFCGHSMMFSLCGIELAEAALHVPEDDPLGARMVRYAAAIEIPPGSLLVSAQVMVGWDGRRPVLHAHGYVALPQGGLLGGHLSPNRCHFRSRGSHVRGRLTVASGADLAPVLDEETGFRLLTPIPAPEVA
ncbi:MAG: hypothetical protein H0X13_03380 [Ramlibacter sp.]|nr:hypothetical protein [Ramlibacter sp.]